MSNYCCAVIGKKLIKMRLLAPMLLGILLLSPDAVTAQIWTGVGSAFIADEESANRYEAIDGQFRHKGSNTGNIYGRCNVTNPMDDGSNPEWFVLEVVYIAPPGMFKRFFRKYNVTVDLIRVDNSTGGVSTVATFSSDNYPPSSVFTKDGVLFSHTFDFHSNAYYVNATVYRKDSYGGPAVSIVRLTHFPPR